MSLAVNPAHRRLSFVPIDGNGSRNRGDDGITTLGQQSLSLRLEIIANRIDYSRTGIAPSDIPAPPPTSCLLPFFGGEFPRHKTVLLFIL